MHSFDLGCAAQTRDRRLISTRDPSGHEAGWWCRALDVGRVLKRARADHTDIVKAAAALGISLVEHSTAMQRNEELVRRLDARVANAQRTGDLQFFNRAYREYRLDCLTRGEPAMSNTAAKSRLKASLTSVAAGKEWPPGVVARIFGDWPPDPQ
jgi:hypothetical protein